MTSISSVHDLMEADQQRSGLALLPDLLLVLLRNQEYSGLVQPTAIALGFNMPPLHALHKSIAGRIQTAPAHTFCVVCLAEAENITKLKLPAVEGCAQCDTRAHVVLQSPESHGIRACGLNELWKALTEKQREYFNQCCTRYR